jgi:hypothetical protein
MLKNLTDNYWFKGSIRQLWLLAVRVAIVSIQREQFINFCNFHPKTQKRRSITHLWAQIKVEKFIIVHWVDFHVLSNLNLKRRRGLQALFKIMITHHWEGLIVKINQWARNSVNSKNLGSVGFSRCETLLFSGKLASTQFNGNLMRLTRLLKIKEIRQRAVIQVSSMMSSASQHRI